MTQQSTPRHIPKEPKTGTQTNSCPIVFTIPYQHYSQSQKGEAKKVTISGWMDKQNVDLCNRT
jgi:hypothetical protein